MQHMKRFASGVTIVLATDSVEELGAPLRQLAESVTPKEPRPLAATAGAQPDAS